LKEAGNFLYAQTSKLRPRRYADVRSADTSYANMGNQVSDPR
jgi:hypothetical protein